MSDELESLLLYCQSNGRVCPVPQTRNHLYQLLPGSRQVGVGWVTPLPLILAAWWEASDDEKRGRLAEHLQWASEHGALQSVCAYLHSLPEEQWHHMGN